MFAIPLWISNEMVIFHGPRVEIRVSLIGTRLTYRNSEISKMLIN